MISRLSNSIALFFTQKNIIPSDETDSYAYGFQVILMSSINWGIILLIMLVSQKILETLLYMAFVILLRHHTGGYHANSHLKCCMLSILMYLIVLSIICYTPVSIVTIISLLFGVTTIILVLKLSPIIHQNNPVNKTCLKKHRIFSIVLSFFGMLLIGLFTFTKLNNLSLSISLGMLQVSASLLIEYIRTKGVSSHENEKLIV